MRKGLGIAASLSIVALTLVVGPLALAQPRSGRARPARPKPAVVVDAGPSEAPAAEDPAAGTPAAPAGSPSSATALASDAGPTAPPAMVGDGGVRLSPLNPAPNELPGSAPPPGMPAVDYDKLLGDIAALRARVAAVGDNLFQSRIAVSVRTEGDHAKIERLVVGLDDGAVYTAPRSFRAEDATTVYDHAVAPGKHAVTVDIERRDDRDESFRTSQRSRFVVDVPKDHRLELEVRIGDDSAMAADFPGGKSGNYDLRVRAKATARPVTGIAVKR